MHQSEEPGVIEQTLDMDDGKAAQPSQETIITPQNAEYQTTATASPATEATPPEDQTAEIESLIHSYSCLKLSFIVKMAVLQNIKALGHELSAENMKREEQSMEGVLAQAILTWEKIHDSGVCYDVQGLEYLRSWTHHRDSSSH